MSQPNVQPCISSRAKERAAVCCVQEVSAVLSAHAQAGSYPALKFAMNPTDLPATDGAYTMSLRIPSNAGACGDLATLCGGPTCMTGLADPTYNNCPAFDVQAARR